MDYVRVTEKSLELRGECHAFAPKYFTKSISKQLSQELPIASQFGVDVLHRFSINTKAARLIHDLPRDGDNTYSARNLKKIQVVPISKAGQPNPWIWLPWWILGCLLEKPIHLSVLLKKNINFCHLSFHVCCSSRFLFSLSYHASASLNLAFFWGGSFTPVKKRGICTLWLYC